MNPIKLSAVDNRIRELVPELQELSFGCEVVVKNSILGMPTGVKTRMTDDFSELQNSDDYDWVGKNIEKIIGHPIRLRDCLKAMDKSGHPECFSWAGSPISNIERLLRGYGDTPGWSFDAPDDLEHQPHAVDFLHDLLCS